MTMEHQVDNGENREGKDHQNQSLIEFLERADKLDGPVGELIRAITRRIESSPSWSLWNALLLFLFLLALYAGLVFLVYSGRIDSSALTLALGILIGLLTGYVKYIFPTRD